MSSIARRAVFQMPKTSRDRRKMDEEQCGTGLGKKSSAPNTRCGNEYRRGNQCQTGSSSETGNSLKPLASEVGALHAERKQFEGQRKPRKNQAEMRRRVIGRRGWGVG